MKKISDGDKDAMVRGYTAIEDCYLALIRRISDLKVGSYDYDAEMLRFANIVAGIVIGTSGGRWYFEKD